MNNRPFENETPLTRLQLENAAKWVGKFPSPFETHRSVVIYVGLPDRFARVECRDYERVKKHHWAADGRGYIRSGALLLHRYLLDAPAGSEVDHKNGDPFDNRRSNLRLCTHQQNCSNAKKRLGGTSSFKGVSRTKSGRWKCELRKGTTLWWKLCDTEIEAALLYDHLASEQFGEFARLNFDHVRGWAVHKETWEIVGPSGVVFDRSKNEEAACLL